MGSPALILLILGAVCLQTSVLCQHYRGGRPCPPGSPRCGGWHVDPLPRPNPYPQPDPGCVPPLCRVDPLPQTWGNRRGGVRLGGDPRFGYPG